jgi:hypothetical protein
MMLDGFFNVVMCKIFFCTLTNQPLRWFYDLSSYYIKSFKELANIFIHAFCLTREPVHMDFLKNFAQNDDETLAAYI